MKQESALNILKMGKNVFLTGGAGTGKTYVLNEYIRYCRSHKIKIAVTASTGIAATHLAGATIHSWSGIGLRDNMSEMEIDSLVQKKYLHDRLKNVKVLVIDEISMLDASRFALLDKVLKYAKSSHAPFGGIQLIVSGDFFQLPPVAKFDDASTFAFTSKEWGMSSFVVCYLTKQYRQGESDDLGYVLDTIRKGKSDNTLDDILMTRLVDEETLAHTIPRLCTHNADAQKINDRHFGELEEEEKEFKATTKGRKNLVEGLEKNILVPKRLLLKKGTRVMCIKNNPEEGYVNGTVGDVIGFDGGNPTILTVEGKEITIEQEVWSIEEDGKVLAQFEQIPLVYAWAITVHKSQGMSMDCACVDLGKAFVYGQGYVALSRLRSLDGLHITGYNDTSLAVDPTIVEVDASLRKQSDMFEKKFEALELKEVTERQDDFITRSDGELEEQKIDEVTEMVMKVSTFEKTKMLIENQKTIEEMEKERKVSTSTILSHIERLLEEEKITQRDIEYLIPEDEVFEEMLIAMKNIREKVGLEKLAPIKAKISGDYSYEDIRFGRVFLL